jgi:Na+/H+-dicarboxylate symporter
MKLWKRVIIGLVAGVVCGLVVGPQVEYIRFIGDLFMNLIKMIVVPLIFFSLVTGITSLSNPMSLGRIGGRATIFYLGTTATAIATGIIMAHIMQPGIGISLNLPTDTIAKLDHEKLSLTSLIVKIIPSNAIGAMANGETLQVVFFAVFTGITINKMEENYKKRLVESFQVISSLIFRMIGIIVNFSPYGAFALSAWVVGTQGMEVLESLGKLIICVLFSMLLQYLLMGAMIKVFAGLSPIPFYKKSKDYQMLAFSTSSTKATLATSMDICQNKMGISESSTSFILPLGASINMNGMAIYLGICAIFFTQATNIILLPYDYFIIIVTATLGTIGASGIPGGSLMMLPMILSSIGVPIEGVALIAGIDRILDMVRSVINITGDAAVTLIIDKIEGQLDEKVYYAEETDD